MIEKQPIIIKKIKKSAHAHHGGAWKIAYADFVTAMMAFFLLMWLLNATSEEQKRGIANYFDPMSLGKKNGGGLGVMGGTAIQTKEGSLEEASSNITIKPSAVQERGAGGHDLQENNAKEKSENQTHATKATQTDNLVSNGKTMLSLSAAQTTPVSAEKDLKKQEQERFDEIKNKLTKEMAKNPDFKELMANLVIDETQEGLRIQVIDQDNKSMFPSGSSKMFDYTKKLLIHVAESIAKVPNKISISGHTDAKPFVNDENYGNWELSTERAAASLRVLKEAGFPNSRVSSVVGKADTELFNKTDPQSPQNRRISIVLFREIKKA